METIEKSRAINSSLSYNPLTVSPSLPHFSSVWQINKKDLNGI